MSFVHAQYGEIFSKKEHSLSSWFAVSEARIVTLGSHGCDRGSVGILCIDEVLPESECVTIRTSRQFEYVLKCGTNLQPTVCIGVELQFHSVHKLWKCTLIE